MKKSRNPTRPRQWKIKRLGEPFTFKRSFHDALFRWGRILAEHQLLESSPKELWGSLSYRQALGFVITSQHAREDQLTDRDLVFVEEWDYQAKQMVVHGAGELAPSALYHAMVYQNRGGVIFTFQVASPSLEKAALQRGFPRVDASPAPDDSGPAQDLMAALGKGNLVVIREGGVLSLGCTADDAGHQILSLV